MTNQQSGNGQEDPRKKFTAPASQAASQNKSYVIEDKIIIKKKSKCIYIDEDVLEVLDAEMKKREKGWAPVVVSDNLRRVFEENGLFEANGITNLKKEAEKKKEKEKE